MSSPTIASLSLPISTIVRELISTGRGGSPATATSKAGPRVGGEANLLFQLSYAIVHLLPRSSIIKGYRATKRFVLVGFDTKLLLAARAKLKACLGAASLLKHTRSPLLTGGSLGVGFLKGGYNILKNCAEVLEGFVGLQLNSAVREGIDALGLAVRVATVGKEIKLLLLIEWKKRTQIECLILGGDLRPGV